MKQNKWIIIALFALIGVLTGCGSSTKEKLPQLKNEVDSLNYAYGLFNGQGLIMMFPQNEDSIDYHIDRFVKGMRKGFTEKPAENAQLSQTASQIGGWLNQQKTVGYLGDSTVALNYSLVRQGLLNGLHGEKMGMTTLEAQGYIQMVLNRRMEEQRSVDYKEFKEENEKFLEDNAKKEGVTVTESGLQYEVLVAGAGEKPTLSDKVKVHYHGTSIDGTVFDSSIERNDPVTFDVAGVIQGWQEGLQLMSKGSKYKFYIPQEIGYGAEGTPGITPFSTLIFEVELLDIIK